MSWSVAVRCVALTLSVLSAGRSWAAVERPVCRQTGPSTYVLSYSLTAPSKSVKITATTDSTGKSGQVPVATTSESTLTVTAGKPGERMYFFLTPDVGGSREVSIRHLELEGTPNFRDVGGYATGDGQFVRWGMLYRSGVLGNLSAFDLKYLSQLGVHVVCDFRTPDENISSPERWIEDGNVQLVNYPIGGSHGQNTQAVMQQLMASNPTPDQLRARMIASYGTFANEYAPAYAAAFDQLEQDHLPLLYHCTAGKDRTGVFTAFVLLTLGVPESTVLDDYALTNGYLAAPAASAAGAKTSATMKSMLAQTTPEQRKVMMAADPAYLQSTLTTINSQYGSFDNYRRTMLKVSDADRDRLRAELLATY